MVWKGGEYKELLQVLETWRGRRACCCCCWPWL